MSEAVSEYPVGWQEEMDRVSKAGRAIYQEKLKTILEPEFNGQLVAIHIDTGDYEVGPRRSHPSIALRNRHPEGGQVLITDVGTPRPDDSLTQRMMAAKYMEDSRKKLSLEARRDSNMDHPPAREVKTEMNEAISEHQFYPEGEMERITELGTAIYENKLKAILEPEYNGQEVAIHVDTGDYEVGHRWQRPAITLHDRHPEGGMLMITDVGPPRPNDTMIQRMMAAKYMEGLRK